MISAIVIAAGLSERMGHRNKLLLPFHGKTIIETIVENLIHTGTREIIIVTGFQAKKVQKVLEKVPVRIIYNPDYEKGMTTSIRRGVEVANGYGYMICLSDMPFISTREYLQMMAFFNRQREADSACICCPAYNHKKGNPVVFSSSYKNEIARHPNMEGCREILRLHGEHVYQFPMASDTVLRDIDTPGDYRRYYP